MTVGERIKALREKLSISQVELADKINVSKQTLYKYENNLITNIPSDKIEAVAEVGGVSPAYLMGWESLSLTDKFSSLSPSGYEELDRYASYLLLSERQSIDVRINSEYMAYIIASQANKLNQTGKVKLLDTAIEMSCNPLYNPNYEMEFKSAHARRDMDTSAPGPGIEK